jgi:hypothetical protein
MASSHEIPGLEARRSDGTLRESGAAWALLFVSVAVFFLHVAFLFREPIDDAGISVAYARTLAEGHGLRVTAESAAAEGYSNPTWTFLLALVELCGFDSVAWLRPLGVAFTALSLPLLALWGPAAERRSLRVEDSLGPLIAATHPSFVHWAQGGLEMGIQTFGIALTGLLALATPTKGRALGLGAAAALVVLTRPEGALYAAAAGVGWLLMMRHPPRRLGPLELRVLLSAALPVLAYVAFRRWYFSEWLPNTYFSKHSWDFDAPQYFRNYFGSYTLLCHATLVAVPLALLAPGRARMRSLQTVLVFAALAFFAYWAKGDWMREWRFLAPLAPFHGALIGAAVGTLRALAFGLTKRSGRTEPYALRADLMAGLLLAGFATYRVVPTLLTRSPEVQQSGWDVAIIHPKGVRYDRVYKPLEPFGMTHPLVIASDMGVVGLGMRDTELWDFAGLTDPAISKHFTVKTGRNFAAFQDFMKNEGPPTVALAWGPANFFPYKPMAQWYDEIAPRHYVLKGLTPRRDPRCPGSKAAILATPTKLLSATILGEARAGKAVQALARWRCAYSYRGDDRLPAQTERTEMAIRIGHMAERAEREQRLEPALRLYSLCAVLSIRTAHPSTGCRKQAEALRMKLFRE